jgi:hypothetical protein
MLGLNCQVTPSTSGILLVTLGGQASVQSGNNRGTIQIAVGTGTPPANGAALPAGSTVLVSAFPDAVQSPGNLFAITALASGLTRGTQYWIGVVQIAPASNVSLTLTNVQVLAAEVG